MNIWSLLEIEATSDIRTIKRAYASKLKTTRPDEQPEAFQELHYAYKAALNYAHGEQQQAQSEPADHGHTEVVASESIELPQENQAEITDDNNSAHLEGQDIETASADTPTQEQDAETNPYQAEGERLIALTNLLLNSHNELHAPESWEFLLHSPLILDDQFNWRLGLEILRILQAHNKYYANKPLMQIGTGVMTYLDGLFNWKLNRYNIYRFLDEEQYSPLLDKIAEQEPLQQTQHALDGLRGAKSVKVIETQKHPNTLYYASPIKRFIALMIDMAGMFLIASLILHDLTNKTNEVGHHSIPPEASLVITLVLSFVYFWVCECSTAQATLGKLIMGLIVTNKDFDQMTKLQGFLRSLVFHLSSLLTYIVLIINAMMGDKLLHDRITKTYVIDMRRSRQQ